MDLKRLSNCICDSCPYRFNGSIFIAEHICTLQNYARCDRKIRYLSGEIGQPGFTAPFWIEKSQKWTTFRIIQLWGGRRSGEPYLNYPGGCNRAINGSVPQ